MYSALSTLNTTTEVPLSKAPNPQLLPGRRSINGCPLLRVCVHGVCVCSLLCVCTNSEYGSPYLAVCHVTFTFSLSLWKVLLIFMTIRWPQLKQCLKASSNEPFSDTIVWKSLLVQNASLHHHYMNNLHLKLYIQRKNRKRSMFRYTPVSHQSSFPSRRWRSNCKCDHVPHIASSHALATV